jgi:DNA helicase HerA-like ATPase
VTLGRVVSVHGSQTSIGFAAPSLTAPEDARVTVGKFLGIRTGHALLIGVVTDVAFQAQPAVRDQGFAVAAQLALFGEIQDHGTPQARFHRGVTSYPVIGDPAALIGSDDLRLIYNVSGANAIVLGQLQQDPAIAALVSATDTVSKHFAVLGTTGVGKSSAVALILQEIMQARPDLRMFVLDVHNEYGRCFGERAQVLNPGNLKLPFWLFSFDEIVDVIFGGRQPLDEEVEILAELIPQAKAAYTQYRAAPERLAVKRADPRTFGYTVDTPVPYRMADLLSLIDGRMGKLENRASRLVYSKLLSRIETVCNDPRYAFMFENANVGGDTMAEILGQLFRLPANGVPVTVMQLAGFPAEVIDAVVSVLCRMAFDLGLWSDGASPLLVVCEEAHRYAAADRNAVFGPTRRALSRIAKEGRKYGVFLGLVTQRPAELDPTILSQCSTLFAMRLTNDRDQAILRSAVSDTAANLLAFLPSLGTREAIAFGEGVALPTRLRFKQLPQSRLPKSEVMRSRAGMSDSEINESFLAAMVERWRAMTTSKPATVDETARDRPVPERDSAPLQPAPPAQATAAQQLGLDPERFRLLKKPV